MIGGGNYELHNELEQWPCLLCLVALFHARQDPFRLSGPKGQERQLVPGISCGRVCISR